MKKNIAMILGIVGIGMSSVAQAEFIVIQESVAKDPYPTSFKVIQQTPQQQMSDTDPLYLQTITELDRLRAENVALRNQLFRNELGVTKQPVYGQATSGNVYRALSGGKFNITTKQAKALELSQVLPNFEKYSINSVKLTPSPCIPSRASHAFAPHEHGRCPPLPLPRPRSSDGSARTGSTSEVNWVPNENEKKEKLTVLGKTA